MAALAPDELFFEAFNMATGDRATCCTWNKNDKGLGAYRMRWLRGGVYWVRITRADGTVKEYGRPETAGRYPLAVVVDTVDGYVYRSASEGELFTVATARLFADHRNSERKLGCQTYRVFKLVPVE